MGARNQVGIGYCYRARQATHPGGIGSLEWILGLLKSLKIRALEAGRFHDPVQQLLKMDQFSNLSQLLKTDQFKTCTASTNGPVLLE
jgi:hypothetical protein